MVLRLFLTLCAALSFISCDGELNQKISNPSPIELYATPDVGVVGDKIEISGITFNNHSWISFNNITHPTRSDSFNISKVFTYVPFDAKTGDIKIENGDLIGVVKDFEVIEQCDDTVCVLPYDLNFSVTEISASRYDPDYPYKFNWEIFFNYDSITIFSRHEIPGESIETINLIFIQDELTKLPRLLDAFYKVYQDDAQIKIIPIINSVIKILLLLTSQRKPVSQGQIFINTFDRKRRSFLNF